MTVSGGVTPLLIRALNNVDFPIVGSPTMLVFGLISGVQGRRIGGHVKCRETNNKTGTFILPLEILKASRNGVSKNVHVDPTFRT